MSAPLCACGLAPDDIRTDPATLHLIGRRATEWMIDDNALEDAPACSVCGGDVPTVRFRCREHYLVLCRRCVSAS